MSGTAMARPGLEKYLVRTVAFTITLESSDMSHTLLKDVEEEEKTSQGWTGQMQVASMWSITVVCSPF